MNVIAIRYKKVSIFLVVLVTLFVLYGQRLRFSRYLQNTQDVSTQDNRREPLHYATYLPMKESQDLVDYMAENIQVRFKVISNTGSQSKKQITFINSGRRPIPGIFWSIYFYDIFPILLSSFQGQDLRLIHIAGNLYGITPSSKFTPLPPGGTLKVDYIAGGFHSSKTDSYPNWYISCISCNPQLIRSTTGEGLDFVEEFIQPEQYKRGPGDRYSPFTPEEKFIKNSKVRDFKKPNLQIIPTPLNVTISKNETVFVSSDDWLIIADKFHGVAQYLSDKLGIKINKGQVLTSYIIQFIQKRVDIPKHLSNSSLNHEEAYRLEVSTTARTITITADSETGAFYAVQSLIFIAEETKGHEQGYKIPKLTIIDAPRFQYRGVMVDLGRNFLDKETVLKMIDVMARYKLNKLHLHLSEDEGWRLQIRGLPELTEIGGRRCHDETQQFCLPPAFGSGPHTNTSGTGFYTIQDYKDILLYAKSRFVQVIPEIDMPGHARAAIKAMEIRSKNKNTSSYLLSDPHDKSTYMSPQTYTDNSINPCIQSTYHFINLILNSIMDLHKEIQPLKLYSYGGDEVAKGSWEQSPKCKELKKVKSVKDLKMYFFQRVSKLVDSSNINIGVWEDAILDSKGNLFQVDKALKGKLYAYAWSNVWEWQRGSLAYKMANAGYKVIMSPATHLYFDHPYEPDPKERGLYWATRYIDTQMVYGYLPDHLYRNADKRVFGEPVTHNILCSGGCPPLEKPENIIGLQANLWSETIRNREQAQYMMFPRLLAMAERSWHKASWEDIKDKKERTRQMMKNWEQFVNIVGHKELLVLEDMGVKFRLDPPGAVFENGQLKVNTVFPGTKTEYSLDGGSIWTAMPTEGVAKFTKKGRIDVRSMSSDGERKSRIVSIE